MTLPELSERSVLYVFILVFFVLLSGFLVRTSVMGYGVGSGGNWYYAWLTSLVIDNDIDFSNQATQNPYLTLNSSKKYFYERFAEPGLTPTGRQGNGTAIGTALLWMPFFILAHGLVLLLNFFGAGFAINGYSIIHQVITLTGSILYATIGMFITYKIARKYFHPTISLIAVLSILFGFATIQYVMIEPSISHAMTIFTVSCFLGFLVTQEQDRSCKKWALAGLLGGIMMLTRWQEGFFMIVPLIYWLRDFWSFKQERLTLILKGFIFVICLLIIFIPQFIGWKVLFGGFLSLPPESKKIMDFANPLLFKYLFSFQHSLLISTPIILISLLGIPALYRKNRLFCVALMITFLLFIYVNSSLQELGGNSFGARRMIDHFFVFSIFLAGFLDSISEKPWFKIVLSGIGILVVFNLFYMIEYDLNLVHRVKEVLPWEVIKNIPKILPTLF